jgi:DNA-directed RNA polymerase specialized sigma24 family protein
LSESGTRQGRLSALRRLSDEEIAGEAASGGDDRAPRVLLERHEEGIYRYTLALVRDASAARDASGGTLIEAERALRAGEYTEPVAAWLYQLAGASAYLAAERAESDQAAEIVAAAGDEDRPRLEKLLTGLSGLGALELSALLLREIAELDYVGIGTAARSRPPVARQAVFRARLALQGDHETPTEHCDEIRGAMSKAETDFRDRRSIASHLDSCPACAEFADQLEQRPRDLRTLFPAPSGALSAELLPSMAGAGAGAAAGNGGNGNGNGDGGRRPRVAPAGRGRRRVLAPLVLALLLVGAAIATALALQDGNGGKKTSAAASSNQAGSSQAGGQAGGTPSSGKKSASGKKPSSGKSAAAKHAKAGAGKGGKAAGSGKRSAKSGAAAAGAGTGTGSGSASGKSGSGTKRGGSSGKNGAPSNNGQGRPRGASPGNQNAKPTPCPRPAASPARSAYSGNAGVVQAELRPCAHGAASEGGGLAATGLELGLLVAAGVCLLALGLGLRRLTATR